jgi:signal transduction histidine kinase
MNQPASPTDNEQQLGARVAELSELLGHLANCWDEERRQLARQLHDNLGSSMTALTMHLGLLAQHLPDDKLEFLGIKAALSELATQFSTDQSIAARASLPDEELQYTREQGVLLLRCAEEGLRNVAAHARASEAEVILDDDGDQAMLTVRDNGAGLAGQPDESPTCHGIRLLRERARLLGGTLVLSARPEGGAALTLTLPHAGRTTAT